MSVKTLLIRLNKIATALKPRPRTVLTESDRSNAAPRVMIIPDRVSIDEWERQSIERHEGLSYEH